MASLKQCDACENIWHPEDHQFFNRGEDQNLCTVSVFAPEESSRLYRKKHSQAYELCQDCAREVIKLLEGRAPTK